MAVISERKIKMLLDREDIEGLFALGAPDDEYQNEAQMIHRAVTKLHDDRPQDFTTEGITGLIREVWQEMFGPMAADELLAREGVFRKVAADICAATNP